MTTRRGAVEWTLDELDELPDDGLQYELLDGLLLVTPAPVPVHQRIVLRLAMTLEGARPPGTEVFVAPLDWRPDRRTSLQPDVLVAGVDEIGETDLSGPLLLAVEVLSPSTRRKDLVLKRSKYEDAGVTSFWIVDPEGPSLLALDLVEGHYREVAHAFGDDVAELSLPFPVTVTPAALVRR